MSKFLKFIDRRDGQEYEVAENDLNNDKPELLNKTED